MAEPSEAEKRLQRLKTLLSERDLKALQYFINTKPPEIARDKSAEMYELFFSGKDCEEIRRLNPGFGLGQIVHARVRDDWDNKKDERQKQLFAEAAPRVAQVQVETATFMADMLAAAVKLHHDKIKKYLQDGNEDHLKGTPLQDSVGVRKMSEIVVALQQVTGQDKKKVVEHRGGLTVNHANMKKVSSTEAADVMEMLLLESEK